MILLTRFIPAPFPEAFRKKLPTVKVLDWENSMVAKMILWLLITEK